MGMNKDIDMSVSLDDSCGSKKFEEIISKILK